MKKINWKDIGIRALKTFIQAFIGSIILGITSIDYTTLTKDNYKAVLLPIAIGGISAGISACWNMISGLLNKGDE